MMGDDKVTEEVELSALTKSTTESDTGTVGFLCRKEDAGEETRLDLFVVEAAVEVLAYTNRTQEWIDPRPP